MTDSRLEYTMKWLYGLQTEVVRLYFILREPEQDYTDWFPAIAITSDLANIIEPEEDWKEVEAINRVLMIYQATIEKAGTLPSFDLLNLVRMVNELCLKYESLARQERLNSE